MRIILILLLLFVPIHSAYARGYRAPKDLRLETKTLLNELQKKPKSPSAHFELAMNYAYTGRIEKGWSELKKVHALNDNYAPVVLKKYSALAKKQPDEWKHHFKIAFGYYFLDKKKEAISSFERVIELDKKNVWAMGFIALLQGESGDIDDAIKTTKQALAIEPKAPALHFLLGQAYYKSGDILAGSAETIKYFTLNATQRR